jgi:predicted amidohydrolase
MPMITSILLISAILSAMPENDTVKVASISMHSVMGDYKTNLDRIEHWVMKAHAGGASFALFPELCVSGALCKSRIPDAEARALAATAYAEAVPRLTTLARKRRMTLVVGLEEVDGDRLYNAAIVVGPEGHLVNYRKLRLPNRTEERWFKPGRELPVVMSQGWKFSIAICADIDKPDYFVAAAARGAEFMLCPIGGSGYGELVGPDGDQRRQAEKHRELHIKSLERASREARLYAFYANQAGRSGDNWFPGLILAFSPRGELLADLLPKEGMVITEVSRQARTAGGAAPTIRNSASEPIEVVEVPGPEKKR